MTNNFEFKTKIKDDDYKVEMLHAVPMRSISEVLIKFVGGKLNGKYFTGNLSFNPDIPNKYKFLRLQELSSNSGFENSTNPKATATLLQ